MRIIGVTPGENNGEIYISNQSVHRRYVLVYSVEADDESQGVIAARSVAGLPQVRVDTYSFGSESDDQAVCKRKSASRDEKVRHLWLVRCEFDSEPITEGDTEANPDQGDALVPKVSYLTEHGERILIESMDKKPVTNAVGELYDSPVTRPVGFSVVEVEFYRQNFTVQYQKKWLYKANSNVWIGEQPGNVVITELTGQSQIWKGATIFACKIRYRVFESPVDGVSSDEADAFILETATKYYDGGAAKWDGRQESLKLFIKDGIPTTGIISATTGKKIDLTQANIDSREVYGRHKRFKKITFDQNEIPKPY